MCVPERFGPIWAISVGVALRCVFGRDLDRFKPFMTRLHSDVCSGKNWTILSHLWKGCSPMCVWETFELFSVIFSRVALRCVSRRDFDHFKLFMTGLHSEVCSGEIFSIPGGCSPMCDWIRLSKKFFRGVALRCVFNWERRCSPMCV